MPTALLAAGRKPSSQRSVSKKAQEELLTSVEEATGRAIHELMRQTAKRLEGPVTAAGMVSPDDLSIMNSIWLKLAERYLMPIVGAAWEDAVKHSSFLMSLGLDRAVKRYGENNVNGIIDAAQENFFAAALSRFTTIVDAIEQIARAVLGEGIALGESIPQLSKRLVDVVPDLAMPGATVISRTVAIGAGNSGSIATARATGAEGTHLKSWLSAGDDGRTRESHLQAEEDYADGIPLDQPFTVGNSQLDYPGDPNGDPAEIFSCRCALTFVSNEEAAQADVPQPLDMPVDEIPAEVPPIEEDLAASGFDEEAHPRDERGRFGQGNSSAGETEQAPSESAWKPVMTSAEADSWAASSAIKEPMFHGTPKAEWADSIEQNGFQVGQGQNSGNVGWYGTGVYLSPSEPMARNYSDFSPKSDNGSVLETRVNVQSPMGTDELISVMGSDEFKSIQGDRSYYDPSSMADTARYITKYATDHGYDSIAVRSDDIVHGTHTNGPPTEMVVFDPKNIVVVDNSNVTASDRVYERDERGRFGTTSGASSGGTGETESPPAAASAPEWKPTMTRADADAWAKDSIIQRDVYHGTVAGDAIRSEGFLPGERGHYGNGVYVTTDSAYARDMAGPMAVETGQTGEVLTSRINVQNPAEGDLLLPQVMATMPGGFGRGDIAKAMTQMAIDQGYDSIHGFEHMGSHEWVVFDPHNVVVVDESTAAPTALAASADVQSGGMIALAPSREDCARLALEGYEPSSDLHSTILFLGEAVDWSPENQNLVHRICAELAQNQPAFDAELHATTTFGDAESPAAVYLLSNGKNDGPGELERIHDTLNHPVLTSKCPEQFSPHVFHTTLAYPSTDQEHQDALAQMDAHVGETVRIQYLRVAFAGEVTDYPLGGGEPLTADGDWDESKHPRDERGQFGQGGGGGGSEEKSAGGIDGSAPEYNKTAADYPPEDPRSRNEEFVQNQNRVKLATDTAVAEAMDTESLYDKINGVVGAYTDERRAIQEDIVKEFTDRPGIQNDSQLLFMGGLPGSGKSTLLRSDDGQRVFGDLSGYVTVNPDEVKAIMAERGLTPDYERLYGLSPGESNVLAHEEASHIAGLIADRAYARGSNVIYDVTLKSPSQFESRVRGALDENGPRYQIKLGFVDVKPEQAAEQAIGRYRGGAGRYTPIQNIMDQRDPSGEYWSKNRGAYQDVRGRADSYHLFQNDGKGGFDYIESESGSRAMTAAGEFDEEKHPRDPRGRFGDGGGGVAVAERPAPESTPEGAAPGWKPVMSKDEADAWAKDSIFDVPLYHGTDASSADSIERDGFQASPGGSEGFGPGVYTAFDPDFAGKFGSHWDPGNAVEPGSNIGGRTLELRVNVQNPISGDEVVTRFQQRLNDITPEQRSDFKAWRTSTLNAIVDEARAEGHDSIIQGGHRSPNIVTAYDATELVVFDPKNVVVVK